VYYLNKIVGAFLNPLGIGLLLFLLTGAVILLKKRRPATPAALLHACVLLAVAWLWFWSMGVTGFLIGLPLERAFPPQLVETMPQADAIVVLGGGISLETNACPYVDLHQAADRVLQGARLYRAGKAKRVFVTCEADAFCLVELGVPREAISGPSKARNTEEEARFIADAMKRGGENCDRRKAEGNHLSAPDTCTRPRVLLVTSAWHMRRAKLMFDRYAAGVEIVPAAADYETTVMLGSPLEIKDFVPDPVALGQNSYMFKEWIAYWGYYFLRR